MSKNFENHEMSDTPWLKSKYKIWKNLLVICLAWVFLFTAFQSMANLQSSLNSDEGLGTASLSTIYVSLVVSCLFVPPALINRIGLKWTIFSAQFTYILYIAANVYPKWYLLIPSAIILGIGAAPLWCAKSVYLTELGVMYARLTGEMSELVINRFFGVFFAFFQTSILLSISISSPIHITISIFKAQIFGNIISSTILRPEIHKVNFTSLNLTMTTSKYCGSKDCPSVVGNLAEIIKKPKILTVYMLCGIYVGLAIIGILIVLFLLESYKRNANIKTKFSFDLFIRTFKQMKLRNQILIIPLTLWIGFEQAFINADFTKSYVTCSIGIQNVGYTMICFGVVNVICSYLYGFLVKWLGRVKCFISGALLNYALILLMLFWQVNSTQVYVLYVIAGLWGMADACWQIQLNSLYGILFSKNGEAAFSNFRLWESIGFALAYAYSNYLCVTIKLYLLFIYLTIGMACYFMIEIFERIKSKQSVCDTKM